MFWRRGGNISEIYWWGFVDDLGHYSDELEMVLAMSREYVGDDL